MSIRDVVIFLFKYREEITQLSYYYNILTFTYSSAKTTYDIGSSVYNWISPKPDLTQLNDEWIEIESTGNDLP